MAWGISVVAAALSLSRRAGWRVAVPLAVAGLAMTVDHAAPFGTIAAIMLGLAVWQFLTHVHRTRRTVAGQIAAA
jgi:hypothetical protein